jgi:hypothetical protein
MRATIPALLTAATLTGCEPIEYGCTDILMWSVTLTLEDESGGVIKDAQVTVTDGTITEDCHSGSDGVYYCGGELSGELTLTAQAVGFAPQDITVTVEADECHVINEEVTATMESVDCTTQAIPSVSVIVTDEAGGGLPDAIVTYAPLTDDGMVDESIDCDALDGAFLCGYEIAGDIEIIATAPGYATAEEVVSVGLSEDGCHVVTEELDIALTAE